MKKRVKYSYFFPFLILLYFGQSNSLFAQHHEPIDSTKSYKNRIFPIPVVFYTPEVKLAYGVVGVYLFKARKDWKNRTSNVEFALFHTTLQQSIIEPIYTVYTHNEKYYLKGTFMFAWRANELFFVPANRNHKSDAAHLTFNNIKINNRVLRRVMPNFYLGIQQQYTKPYNVEIENDPIGYLKNKYFKTSSGVGPALLYDTRDLIMNPSKGHFVDFGATFFEGMFGSERNFTNLFLDARYYRNGFLPHSTLAFNVIGNFNIGDTPPISQLATLGGSSILRGFYRGRYKSRHGIVFQTEYRQRIKGRLGMTLFAGAGEVAEKMPEFDFEGINLSYGGGLRLMFKKDERLNLRFDVGFGNNDSYGFYVGVGEVF